MDAKSLNEFAAQVRTHAFEHVLPFWSGPALDRQQGGWMGWLTNDLKADRTQPKGLVVNTRILWAFSAAHGVRQEALYHDLAERALDFVLNRFWDPQHGGAFWQLDDTGRVRDDHKKIYGQSFYIYALAEYYRAFNAAPALARAKEMFELLERHGHEPKHGGYLEVCKRDWSEAGSEARLSDKDYNARKSMNTNLHMLEAYTNLYRVWREPRVAERLRELIRLFLEKILDPRTLHFHHFFDDQWKVLSDTCTFGHDIEGSWLLCEAAEVLGDKELLHQVETVAVRMAEVALNEGVAPDGALLYEGKDGKIVDAGKEWWPQAEAMVGFVNAFQLSGQTKFAVAARRVWEFADRRLVDRVHGEWFWRILPAGKVDEKMPKVSEWKGPYHVLRGCLETAGRLTEPATRAKLPAATK